MTIGRFNPNFRYWDDLPEADLPQDTEADWERIRQLEEQQEEDDED